jgi:hypothetical protein
MKRRTAKDQERTDRSYLFRAWRRWHREQLEKALAGMHGAVLAHLMQELKNVSEARDLVNAIAREDWTAVDTETRLVALHEINAAITKLREKRGLNPFDDPLPGAPPNVFQIIRSIISNGEARRSHFGNQSMETSNDE